MYNDIHIDNYSSHARNFDHIYLKEGISFAFALADKLIVMQKPFYIYVLYNGFDGYKEAFEAVFGDANQIVDCNVRFHEKRPNETWGVDDLEESKLEATLLISIQEG
ncbi:hypothetical protein FACS189430_11770 [Bacteroidia bacterium]|nr:hypothetical protein FACS189430_11770 [Bacteroidia bacterium]